MVLLFLRDWRSALVVVLNIPLALLAAVMALWVSGQTINIMTLGRPGAGRRHPGRRGDRHDREHPHPSRAMAAASLVPRATRRAETTLPRFLAMLCILAVFIPAFFMEGAAHNLFVPLALAVGFSMVASYLLSSTLVPVLSVWMLRSREHASSSRKRRFSIGFVPGTIGSRAPS